jgi:sulfate transporter 4
MGSIDRISLICVSEFLVLRLADSGFIPIFVYALFGSSRQLAIGPVALVSLLISNGLTPIVDLTKEGADIEYTQLAILLALMVGVLECLMGILR